MNDRAWSDTLRMVIEMLSSTLPDATVADRMPPPGELDQQLPYVMVDLLPGEEVVAWGGHGPVRDFVVLDIDVFAASRALAHPTGVLIRQLMHNLPNYAGANVTYVDCPGFSTRPDYNPHIRRLGVTVTLHVPA